MKRYITERLHYAMLMILMLMAGVQAAHADNTEFEKEENFMCIKNGQATVHFRLLTWAYGTIRNHYAGSGSYVYVNRYELKADGSRTGSATKYTVLDFNGSNGDDDRYTATVNLKTGSGTVTNSKDYATGYQMELDKQVKLKLNHTSKHTYLEMNWYPPQDLLVEYDSKGNITKRYELEFHVEIKDKARDYSKNRSYPGTANAWSFNMSDDFRGMTLSEPVFYPMGGESGAGKIAIPYSLSSEPISYHDNINPGNEKPLPSASGMIYVQTADTCFSTFMIDVKAWRDKAKNLQWQVKSAPVLLPAYHSIHNFKVSEYIPKDGDTKGFYTGSKHLTWEIHHADETDIMDNDVFVIERAYTSDFSDATQIGNVLYIPIFLSTKDEEGKSTEHVQKYEYVDDSKEAWYNANNPELPVYYRVRRASSQNWGWNHPYAAKDSITKPVYLAAPSRNIISTITKEDNFTTNRRVTVSIAMDASCVPAEAEHNMKDGSTTRENIVRNLVWDSSATLNLLRIMSYNPGEPGDTVRIPVLPTDIKYAGNCWKATVYDTPNLPCLHYSYMVEVKTNATTRLLQLTPEHIENIVAPTKEGSVGDYKIDVTGLNGVPDYSPMQIPCDEDFYFDEAAAVTNLQASNGEYNDHVHLTWETTGGASDYFEVYRIDSLGRKMLISDPDHALTVCFINDSTAVGGAEYDYYVTSNVQCHGAELKTNQSSMVKGSANREAHISGKIHYTNGMAIGGITVATVFKGDTIKAVTADDGSYELIIKERPHESTKLTVFPIDTHGYEFTLAGQTGTSVEVNIGDLYKNVRDCDFQSRQYVQFNGRVLYEGTSVPVPGTSFLISGKVAKNSYGKEVQTDSQGEFALTVPKGMSFTLRAQKKGHTFMQDGYFMMTNTREELDSVLYFTESQNLKYMYDKTKVRLIGRVVGGDKQGNLPLGTDQSVNNLGDDLQMVFQLEGNDVARLVYEQQDKTLKERDTVFVHEDTTHHTRVHTEAKRVVIRPDSLSGEYVIDLLPVKYKVTQATAKGYSTLFDKSTGAPVVDLTNCIDTILYVDYKNEYIPHNAKFSIIYHAPVQLTFKQSNYGRTMSYFGEKQMALSNFGKENVVIDLASEDEEGKMTYNFGYPVFNGMSLIEKNKNRYAFELTAHEDYYYNNNRQSSIPDMVFIPYGKVKISNGLDIKPDKKEEYITLDGNGRGIASVTVDNPTFSLTGEDALRTLSFSMDYNGQQVFSETLKAFVTGAKHLGSDVIGKQIDVLDVLRDPPGSASYSWIEEGTTYTGSYSSDISYSVGAKLEVGGGNETGTVTGLIAGGTALQAIQGKVGHILMIPFDFVYSDKFKNAYSYTFTTTQRIQTSSADTYVGNAGNVYIGTEISNQINRYKSISIIDDETRERVAAAIKAGEVKILATGSDAEGKPIHLAISDQISFTAMPTSDFAYTQKHILKNLLPELQATRNALIQIAAPEVVQRMADEQGKVMYSSLISDPNDIAFGTPGTFNVHYPNGKGGVNEVKNLNEAITSWVNAIALNERLTLEALTTANKQNGVNVSAGTFIQHSEQAQTSYSYSTPNSGYQALNSTVKMISSQATKLLSLVLRNGGMKDASNGSNPFEVYGSSGWIDLESGSGLFDIIKRDANSQDIKNNLQKQIDNCNFGGVDFRWQLTPVVEFNDATNAQWDKKGTRSVGYKIEEGTNGHISVGVYRTTKSITAKGDFDAIYMPNQEMKGTDIIETIGDMSTIFKLPNEETRKDVNFNDDYYQPASFVFMKYGGATRCPYEDAEYTYFYMPGTKLSNATLKIDNPRIQVTNPVVSNVAEDEPAVFDVILENDSEAPDADEGLIDKTFNFSFDTATNPNGARLFLDGTPLANGISLVIPRGVAVHKKLEVYRGTEDDYENIRLLFHTSCEFANRAEIKISAHFQPTSSPVNLSSPTDKWIMNTLSAQNEGKFYIPVKIDGFNTQYRNFDHIELQYKRSTQPDDAYVNVCSFYADSLLYAKASGEKQIFTGGVIDDIYFYGDNDPIEQSYDLRAVTFCRLGNGFVTRSSKVLSGIKDTRRPEVFGALSPKNGILGMGDYIGIPFSENIAGNHLDKTTNFEVMGYTNKTGIVNSTSIVFSGVKGNKAESQVNRNLTDKNFTVDFMMQPNGKVLGQTMTMFTHGNKDTNFEVGFARDLKLFVKITMDNKTMAIRSDEDCTDGVEWSRIAVVYHNETGETTIYNGNKKIGSGYLQPGYNGSGKIIFGNDLKGEKPYAGNMLEARLWTRALDEIDLTNTNRTTLSGYERMLLAYYPMNEGKGNIMEDKANGADLHMNGQTWRLPSGRSLHFDGTRGVRMDESLFRRSSQNDYMLGLWFKAEEEQKSDTVAFYAEGSGRKGDPGLFLGLQDKQLTVAQNGFCQKARGNYADGNWHHLVMGVSRVQNLSDVYVDGLRVMQFAADSLGALGAQRLLLGAFRKEIPGEKPEDVYCLNGNIDDVMLWEVVMSEGYMKHFDDVMPNGGEKGLLVNLPFSTAKADGNNFISSVFNAHNQLVKREDNASIAEKAAFLDDYAEELSDALVIAPVREKDLISTLNFSFASRENELVINLLTPDEEINKQNVFITVSDVEDMAGNTIASPVNMTLFVDRNQLKWEQRYVTRNVKIGETDEFSVDIHNHGGSLLNYEIEELPSWLETDDKFGYLDPTDVRPVRFRVKNNLNPGEHSVLIYLTDENGLSEPLLVMVNVEAVAPTWEVDREQFPESMNVIASVLIAENDIEYYDTDKDDIVGAFMGNICVGKQHVDTSTGQGSVYMSVYGNQDMTKDITFRLWRSKTGQINTLELYTADGEAIPSVKFQADKIMGQPSAPIKMKATQQSVQMLELANGWNWVSFNIVPQHGAYNFASAISNNFEFTEGDLVKTSGVYAEYFEDNNVGFWDGFLGQFDHKLCYMFRVAKGGQLEIPGRAFKGGEANITLHKGWNYLPYYGTGIMSLTKAMADYTDEGGKKVSEGDIVKSYTEFSVWSNGRWNGSLTDMRPGQGYMLQKHSDGNITFNYPTQTGNLGGGTTGSLAPAKAPRNSKHSGNMTVVAKATHSDGRESAQGDLLQAFAGGTLVGEAVADEEGKFYLMTSAENGSPLSFRLTSDSDGEEESAASAPVLIFDETSAIGSVGQPFMVDFRKALVGANPNPFHDVVTFHAVANIGDDVHITVHDPAGKTVFTHTAKATDTRYIYTTDKLASLAPGIYVANIRVAGRNHSVKMIHQ